MRISERLLLRLSAAPGAEASTTKADRPDVDNALVELHEAFPDLVERIRGRRVLDFGCGFGVQAVALAKAGAAEVLGLDLEPTGLEHGRELARQHRVSDRVRFATAIDPAEHASFDTVISLNSMEHFSDPASVLELMRAALRPDGELLVSFSPPWYAPYGSHMGYFTRTPWVHLLFSEHTVMSVRRRYRKDGATRYEDVDGGLNRMSLAKFERLIRTARLRPRALRYDTVKRIPAVGRIPLLRELLVNRVSCALQPER